MAPAAALRALPFVLLLLLILPLSPSAATVDTLCPVEWWQMEWNVVSLGPIGQEFSAARDRMSFADLWLAEGPSMSTGVELVVRVREADLNGALVGTSRPLLLPDGFNDFARFSFDTAVPLVVGQTYFLEIARGGDSGYAMVRGAFEDPCPGPRAWIQGAAHESADLWYQVGWDATVSVATHSWGAWKARY